MWPKVLQNQQKLMWPNSGARMKYIIEVAEKCLIKETHKMFSTSFKIYLVFQQ